MIKVRSEVSICEIDGNEQSSVPMPTLTVASHWNRDSLVVLEVAGKRLSVSARDLEAAIRNATNSGRH